MNSFFMQSKFRKAPVAVLLLAGVVLSVFLPVCNHEFVIWDDQVNVYENSYLHPVKPASLVRFWQAPYQNLYIPATYTVWAAIAHLTNSGSTLNPKPFHTANLVVHLLATWVVFTILRRLVHNTWAATAGAALFALHPVQVEAVVWVTGMKDVLCGSLSLIAMWQYLLYLKRGNGPGKPKGFHNLIFASTAFLLALLAKPSAIVVPLMAFLLVSFMSKRNLRETVYHKRNRPLIAWVLLGAVTALLTSTIQQGAVPISPPVWLRPLIFGDALAFYFYKILLPINLTIDYGRSPEVILGNYWSWVAAGVVYAVIFLLFHFRYRLKTMTTGIALFVTGLLPVSGLVPFVFQNYSTVADRYLYLSMVGPSLLVAVWLSSTKTKQYLKTSVTICLVAFALLVAQSKAQVAIWSDNANLFSHAIRKNPQSSMAYGNLGLTLDLAGKASAAVDHFREALRLKPDNAQALNNWANVLMKKGKPQQAIVKYRKAIKYKPDYAKAHNNLAVALSAEEPETSVHHFKKALEFRPNFAGAYFNLANILKKQGRNREAITYYEKALTITPHLADARYNLANILFQCRQTSEAIAEYRNALALNPDDPQIHNNLGIALARAGNVPAGIEHFKKALQIDPDFRPAQDNLEASFIGNQP